MEIISAAVVGKIAEAKLVEANAIKNAIDSNSVAPLGMILAATLAEIYIPAAEIATPSTLELPKEVSVLASVDVNREVVDVEYAGLLNGMLDAEKNQAGMGGEIGRYYDQATEKMAVLYDLVDVSVAEFIEGSGIKESVQLGLQESITWLEQATGKVTFSEARLLPDVAETVIAFKAEHGIEEATQKLAVTGTDVTIAVGMKDLATFEQSILQWCDEKGMLITAKRIDFQVESEFGTEYVPGLVTELPLIGGLANIASKQQLGAEVVTGDYEQLVTDAINIGLVLTVSAAPFLLPVALLPAGIGAFTLKSALISASIGGIHGGLQNGAVSVIRGEATMEIFASTGSGLLTGAVLGGIGGAIGGAVLYKAGASLASTALAGSASGSATDAMGSGGEALLKTGDVAKALEAAGSGALAGGIAGGLTGAGGHVVGRITSKIQQLPNFPVGLDQPSGLMVKIENARSNVSYGGHEIELGLRRHHVKPLSLGGTDSASNIQMVPAKIHNQPHPPVVVRDAPAGTIFYNK